MSAHQELFELAEELEAHAALGDDPAIASPLQRLMDEAHEFGRSFSGSWLGYHSRVYYSKFTPPPPGAHFSIEWGLAETFADGTTGDWREFDFDQVKILVKAHAGDPDLCAAEAASERAKKSFDKAKASISSILQTTLDGGVDLFLQKLGEELENLEPKSPHTVAQHLNPHGRVITRDMIAMGQGTQIPPHISVTSEVLSIRHSFQICAEACVIARKAASHLERKGKRKMASERIGTNVFIGHGRAPAWRDLKDFLQDRLGLPYDEFNRVPIAGVTNIQRLSQMLDSAAIAFLVMTAEDEQADGSHQARMNVIHEAGLFQGRLGFDRAIVLLEDGCTEFSNIAGLGQIRFPAGNIKAVFEDIRAVLEREGLSNSGP